MKAFAALLILIVGLVGSFQQVPVLAHVANTETAPASMMGMDMDCEAEACAPASTADCLAHCFSEMNILVNDTTGVFLPLLLGIIIVVAAALFSTPPKKSGYVAGSWYPPRYLFQTIQLLE